MISEIIINHDMSNDLISLESNSIINNVPYQKTLLKMKSIQISWDNVDHSTGFTNDGELKLLYSIDLKNWSIGDCIIINSESNINDVLNYIIYFEGGWLRFQYSKNHITTGILNCSIIYE